MSNPIHTIFLVGVLALFVLPAILVARMADRRGRSFVVYLVAGLIVGWIIPLLAVLILPARREDQSATPGS